MRITGAFLLTMFFVIVVGFDGFVTYATMDTVTNAQIVKTERVVTDRSSKYLVYTKDETFQDTDTIWLLKYNSSDIYGKIDKGATCTFKVTGWRVPFLSWYRNILSADCH